MTYPFILKSSVAQATKLSPMREVLQTFETLPALDVNAAISSEWLTINERVGSLNPDASVAVAVGSRGIGDLVPVVRSVIARLERGRVHTLCGTRDGIARGRDCRGAGRGAQVARCHRTHCPCTDPSHHGRGAARTDGRHSSVRRSARHGRPMASCSSTVSSRTRTSWRLGAA